MRSMGRGEIQEATWSSNNLNSTSLPYFNTLFNPSSEDAINPWVFFRILESSSHVWIWELDHKESWAPKIWCFWTVVWEKTLESPLDSREIKPVNPKGNQSWIFTGRTDAEAPVLWPPDEKNWLIRKDPDAGERLKVRGEGDDRGWDGWMASLTQWTQVWASSRSWWRTEKPGVLQSMRSQSRTRLSNWTELRVLIQFVFT